MLYIKNNINNPYFNTASEEYILENFDEDNIFMLWRNEPCVYLGINQNAYAEINLRYAKENNIKVVRRLSGGGCVYHDMGNINFSFFSALTDNPDKSVKSVKSVKSEEYILNFAHYTKPVIQALKNLGINAELQGRNDLLIAGMKFSGNAQCVYTTKTHNPGRKKLLHHGTILFDADITRLSRVLNLNADEEKIKSRSVKSINSRVTNVKRHLPENIKMSAEQFKNYLENYIVAEYENNCKIYNFSREDIKNIQELADNYYCTADFIYGSKIKYSFGNKKRFDFGTVEIYFNVRDFKLSDVKIYGDFFGGAYGAYGANEAKSIKSIKEIEACLNGLPHEINAIKNGLCGCLDKSRADISEFIKGCDIDKFLELFM